MFREGTEDLGDSAFTDTFRFAPLGGLPRLADVAIALAGQSKALNAASSDAAFYVRAAGNDDSPSARRQTRTECERQ